MTRVAPAIEIISVRQIFNDGNHNAFTDLCQWNGEFYTAFRSSPSGHDTSDDASIVILGSADGVQWREVHRCRVAGWDLRDPHFLILQNRLHVLCGAGFAQGQVDLYRYESFMFETPDGVNWTQPQVIRGAEGHFVW